MLLEIFIIQKGSSFLLLHRSFTTKTIAMNGVLFSGMISAISLFTKELKIGQITHFETGDHRVLISSNQDIIVVGIVEESKEDNFVEISLKKISEQFYEQFGQNIKNWNGDTQIFEPFAKNVDEIVYSEFTQLYISKDFPKHVIKVIRQFQDRFEPNVMKLIGFKAGQVRARNIKTKKQLKKKLRKELDLISINHVNEFTEENLEIEINLCPVCRGIKNDNFSCKFIEGFIEGFLQHELLADMTIKAKETSCIAHGDKACIFSVEMI
ncbi:hypothetical protein NEF87_000078 [Candidatus Lokiarchaeum ossiferum]|uniref:4-vinyl reductase 4VR domain-containing protein n=1 Tax=Candidatus Lokiarchaeum ossiferum TaxID=2951803 RepID=A0ABY6HJU2_9ARCH|nr:hypothetical protein NEF87_000078 [Candidatus Lokiarchaeum sp. B-35]